MGVRRRKVKDAVGKPCCYCKRNMLPRTYHDDPDPLVRNLVVTEEHVQPRAYGGSNTSENIEAACFRCNNLRGHLDHAIFSMYSRHVLQAYPDAPTVYLRSSLQRFVTSLAEIAIKNRRESARAISHALLVLGDDLKRANEIDNNPQR